MNNIGRIVFGCIAVVIIIAAIILLIPFGMSAESAKKLVDETFTNLTEVSKTAKYVQVENEYYTIYYYDSAILGNGADSQTAIGRIDFKKAVEQGGKAVEGAYTSGSVIIGKMDTKWYVIKTATNGKEGDEKYYYTFSTKNEATQYIKTNIPQASMLCEAYNQSLADIIGNMVQKPDESLAVTGGSKAIAGAATVTCENKTDGFTQKLQISNNLIKKVTITQKGENDKTETQSFTVKYNGELKMTNSLVSGLTDKTPKSE